MPAGIIIWAWCCYWNSELLLWKIQWFETEIKSFTIAMSDFQFQNAKYFTIEFFNLLKILLNEIAKGFFSPSGNWTPVSRVTGGDTYHYTNEDACVNPKFFPTYPTKELRKRMSKTVEKALTNVQHRNNRENVTFNDANNCSHLVWKVDRCEFVVE